VRTLDILTLALAALLQRKLRALLTTLGVAVGSFLLVSSVAIGQGVQKMLLGQLRKQDQLRQVVVWQGAGGRAQDVPSAALELPGEMSEARRGRLREAVIRRWKSPPRKAPPGLSAARVAELAALEHVVSVTPGLAWTGKASLGGNVQPAYIRAAAPDDPAVVRRIVAGHDLGPGEAGLLVSEYLVYRWGMTDQDAVGAVLGRPVQLDVAGPLPGVAAVRQLLNLNQPDLTPEDLRVLNKAVSRLPLALAHLDLPDKEQQVLLRLLRHSRPDARRAIRVAQPVVGVFRDVSRSELSPWDALPRPVDVLVSGATAEQIYFAVPGRTTLPQVTVRVDEEKNVPLIDGQIRDKGLEVFSLVKLVEQVRLNMLLIQIACAFVATIALTVAGLGITNTMLMSVLERRHEIGVMKAVGARDLHVQAVFLMEGAVVGAAGGLVGLLAGWLASYPGDAFARWLVARDAAMRLDGSVFLYPPWLVAGGPALVCLLTTAAAVYPARRAAQVDPAAALRQR
jgi:putative ABC transport system permease protein